MMRKRNRPVATRSKNVQLTGGIKDDVSQLELDGGELIACENYQEIDGLFHGYSSVTGYERLDGQELASEIPLDVITDKGVNESTLMYWTSLGETSGQTITVSVGSDVRYVASGKFLPTRTFFYNLDQIMFSAGNLLDVQGQEFTIDFLCEFLDPSTTETMFKKDWSYKMTCDSNRMIFEWSDDGATWTDSHMLSKILLPNKTYHVAVCRIKDQLRFFVDGELDSSHDLLVNMWDTATTHLYLGGFRGYLDEFRISDIYMWYEEFDIPTKSYSDSIYYEYKLDDVERELQRALILEVPGEGPILSVGVLDGIVGAIRDNVGATKSDLFASTAVGWSAPILGAPILSYDTGKDVDATPIGFQPGDTITGTGGASAVVRSINLVSGVWSGAGTAQGLIVLETISSPPFLITDTLTSGTSTATVLAGSDPTDVFVLEAGGDYELLYASFPEMAALSREKLVYNANGVNPPSYFDGSVLVPILHTNLPDSDGVYATHIIEFKNRLILGYPDGRLWYSGVNSPHFWDVATEGAGEFFLEDEITAMVVAPGDALIVFCRNSTQIIKTLADSGVTTTGLIADYAFFNESFSKRSGCIPATTERLLGDVYFLDDRGLTSLSASDTFGDFSANAISKNVQRRLISRKDQVIASGVQREYNQYRLFFDDKTALFWTFNADKEVKGITQVRYKDQMTCFAEGEEADGSLMLVFGTDDGFVMRMDSGTSFDGEEIETFMTTSYHHYGSATDWKHFKKATLEATAERGLEFHARPDFNYREPGIPKSVEAIYESVGYGGIWGEDQWNLFQWGVGQQAPALYFSGYGTNMSMTFTTSNKFTEPHVINSMIIEYSRHARKM